MSILCLILTLYHHKLITFLTVSILIRIKIQFLMRCELEFGCVFCVCGTFAVRQVPPTQMGSSRRGRLRRWHTHTHAHKQTYTYTVTQCYFDTVFNVAAILLLEATFFVLCRIFDLVFDCSNSVLFSVAVVVVVVGFLVLCCIFFLLFVVGPFV